MELEVFLCKQFGIGRRRLGRHTSTDKDFMIESLSIIKIQPSFYYHLMIGSIQVEGNTNTVLILYKNNQEIIEYTS